MERNRQGLYHEAIKYARFRVCLTIPYLCPLTDQFNQIKPN